MFHSRLTHGNTRRSPLILLQFFVTSWWVSLVSWMGFEMRRLTGVFEQKGLEAAVFARVCGLGTSSKTAALAT